MWVYNEINGNAINNETGEEIYLLLGADGLTRVYKKNRPINTFKKIIDAKEFVKKHVEELNGEEK